VELLTLIRSGETFQSFGKEGCRGIVLFGDQYLHTLERGDGYKWLRPGVYTLEIAKMNRGKTPALRVLGDYSRGRIYLHAATRPGHLKGCVAVGLSTTRWGLRHPRPAMALLFDFLGGFRVGEECRLVVKGEI